MKRFALAAAMAAGIGFAEAQTTVEQPDAFGISQIMAFTTQELFLPANAGEPFRVMVDLGGQMVLLDMAPHSVRSPNIVVMINDETGRHEMTNVPAPATYRGEADGQPGSSIAASLVDGQLSATIDLEQGWFWVIEPMTRYEPNANPMSHIVYRSFEVIEKDGVCGVVDDALVANDIPPATGSAPEATKILDLAIENDFEFFQFMGNSTSTMIQTIEGVINRVDVIYSRDVDVVIEIVRMELRTTSNDPYSTNNAVTILNQFSSFWAANRWATQPRYDLAQLFSGRSFNQGILGIAWLNGVCSQSIGYSVIQLRGLSSVFRAGVSAHEMGHNFNAPHCSGGDCRIMCAGLGGCARDVTRFGQSSIGVIARRATRARCLSTLPPPTIALPFLDPFPSTTFTPNTWATTANTFITTIGVNPPSAPNTATMNQIATFETIDVLVSASIFPTPVFVSYWVQHRAVESGETLQVEYRDSAGVWQSFETIVSNGSDPQGFKPSEFTLNQAAYSDTFRLRFKALGDDGNDLWMIDDVSISDRCLADITGDGSLDLFDFLAYQNLFVTSSPRADLTGDGSFDIFDFLAYQNMFVTGCY